MIMLWRCNFLLITIFSLLFTTVIKAQSCVHYPADCPSDQLGDSVSRMANPVIPKEVHMEIEVHETLTALMQTQADKNSWEVYQYDESDGSGFKNAENTGPLDDHLRPPHNYEISFIFIVNQDSLRAWQEWEKEFNTRMTEEVEKMKSTNDFSAVTRIQKSKKDYDERFRNSSMIRVKFDINPENAIVSSILDNLRVTAQLHVTHAAVAIQAHNDKTDERAIFGLDQLNRCSDLAFVLFGKWNMKPDSYQYYHPVYSNDKKNTDQITPKNIPSDKVRTIALHVEGSPRYINSFLQSLDTEKINNMIFQ
jgi:hypothetical protein